MKFHPALLAAVLSTLAIASAARADVDLDAKAKAAAQSLVIVDVTLRNENNSREDSAQGILLSKEGVVLISGSLISENMPKEWITDIKVRSPGKNFEAVPAKFLGRTRNRVFAYLKTETPIDAPAFQMGEVAETKLGTSVFSVSVSPRTSGYTTYVGKSDVRALLELSHTFANTATFGLTRGTSPVYELQTGKFAGITVPALPEAMWLRDSSGGMRQVELTDDEQTSVYLPASEIEAALKEIPNAPFEARRGWIAIDNLTGMPEEVRELRKIQQPSGVIIGNIIPNESAEKSGLQARDIVLTVDGKEFSKSPVPDMMIIHFRRELDKKKPGEKVKLGLLRDGKPAEVELTLSDYPKIAAEMPHVLSKVGVVTRDLVFFDAYSRRLPQDTKGVAVALVKSGSPASLGSTPLAQGHIITKVDDQPVENQAQFLALMKKIEDNPEQKEAVFVVIQGNGDTRVCRVDLTK